MSFSFFLHSLSEVSYIAYRSLFSYYIYCEKVCWYSKSLRNVVTFPFQKFSSFLFDFSDSTSMCTFYSKDWISLNLLFIFISRPSILSISIFLSALYADFRFYTLSKLAWVDICCIEISWFCYSIRSEISFSFSTLSVSIYFNLEFYIWDSYNYFRHSDKSFLIVEFSKANSSISFFIASY